MCSQASLSCPEWINRHLHQTFATKELIVTIIVLIKNLLLGFEVLPYFQFSLSQTNLLLLTGEKLYCMNNELQVESLLALCSLEV